MIVEEKTISNERIYDGVILNLRRDKVTVKGGKTSYREIVEHPGGVVIAAVTPEGKIPMVKQYRKAAEKAVLEIPAGKLEKNEDPSEAGLRELKEETGYTAKTIDYVNSFYSSIGYSDEVLHLYIARDLTPGETEFDDNEAIDIYEYSIDELLEMIFDRTIEDAKTIIAIFMLKTLI